MVRLCMKTVSGRMEDLTVTSLRSMGWVRIADPKIGFKLSFRPMMDLAKGILLLVAFGPTGGPNIQIRRR